MGAWDNLKQRLREAGRQIRRLAGFAFSPAVESGDDVSSRITVAILSQRRLDDAVAISAMRSCLERTIPEDKKTLRLHKKLQQIEQRDDVTTGEFREAIEAMLQVAAQHENPEELRAFVRYLALLAQ